MAANEQTDTEPSINTVWVNMTSSYAVGLAYELLVVRTLSRYSFSLRHCGKGGDRGEDFVGQWILPGERVQIVGTD